MPATYARRMLSASLLLSLSGCVVPVPLRRYSLSSDVLFASGRANLRPEAEAALEDTLAQIRSAYVNPLIRVEGHTDSIGSDAANDALSLRRAEVVRNWLIQAGVPPMMISTQGYGRREPVASNDTAEGRALNRRVELIASPG